MGDNVVNINDYLSVKDLNDLFDLSYKELLYSNKCINLLKPMSKNINQKIIKHFDLFDDVSAFIINYNGFDRVVLRYINSEYNNVDFSILKEKADIFFENGSFDKSIKIYTKVLQGQKEPDPEVYYRLGILNFKTNIRASFDYLKIAIGLSNGVDMEKYLSTFNKYKNIVKEKNDNVFIENFDNIIDYILASELDVESACKKLNLSREKIDIIKLKIAEIYFINSDVDKGMEFIKSVESSNEKTFFTKKLLKKIVTNIKFYPNKKNDNVRVFSRKLKPGYISHK